MADAPTKRPQGYEALLRDLKLRVRAARTQAAPDQAIVQGPLAQITWWHNLALLQKVTGLAASRKQSIEDAADDA